MKSKERTYTTREVAEKFGLTQRRVIQMITGIHELDNRGNVRWKQEPFLPARQSGSRKEYRIAESDLHLVEERPPIGWRLGRARKHGRYAKKVTHEQD